MATGAIFQKQILANIVQDESLVKQRFTNYEKLYKSKVDFIKTIKEEEYQDGFLRDIFVACLGYKMSIDSPNDFNISREKKNQTDSKKADGAIWLNGDVIGVIELKDCKTKDLNAVEAQAFNYHNSHSNSKYIVISNFNKLRFYIDKKTEFEEFNLFELSYEEFVKLHLMLSFESIKAAIPLSLKEHSITREQNISKYLYKDFSAFRTNLFENLLENNGHTPPNAY
ncbi:type I restriction enzyme HsdR N-terminal domain-containing protein [Campylobacter fetus]|uniref:type I restriction enzyme HsdR N-terminal domain-containing protein n=1 Tax=Campylobacter fetus TaxID=196 RepID=UPI000818BB30|nr:type I restriction enzyme HsdR N-terminal domain-containing protein [Campylobacter fetus]OCS05837.1 hypothetical protein AC237_01570 [Campylobacter fetus subsp. testudinum]